MRRTVPILALALLSFAAPVATQSAPTPAAPQVQHRVLVQGNSKLAIVGADGEVEWEMDWGGIHDVHRLSNGHILVQDRVRRICEIDPETREVVWDYDCTKQNGNDGRRVEAHAFQPLDGFGPDGEGTLMIAESGPARILEVDRDGGLRKSVPLKVEKPHPHRDTRLVRKLDSGNYLVCHEGDGAVREYDGETGDVVWEFRVPLFGREPKPGHGPEAFGNQVFSAVRLASGNTLIGTGNGHAVLEVTPEGEIVWELHQDDLDGIRLAWVTTLEVLPNGHYVIGNCHAGPGQPLLVEIDPKTREVVWTFDHFERFGNSVSNTLLLDAPKGTRR